MVATKLHVPTPSGVTIARAETERRLETAVCTSRTTIVCAPAGWGKTTLLARWAARQAPARAVAWVSLDPADNDGTRFWNHVIGALAGVAQTITHRASKMLEVGADIDEIVLPALLSGLMDDGRPVTLVLDDYRVITDTAVRRQFARFADGLPDGVSAVVATRSDPGSIVPQSTSTVSTDELRFSATETDSLLNGVLGLGLSHDEVHALWRRTEGWAAGLYLFALSAAGRIDTRSQIDDFVATNRLVADYLSEEVIEQQDPDVRKFLLYTSILDRLNDGICGAVMGSPSAAAVLERVVASNLFLVSLDSARCWYRYYHLFGDMLRAELGRTDASVIPQLHRRAAEWFRDNGSAADAITHFSAAGDQRAATETVCAAWVPEFNRGGLATVSAWLDRLPRDDVTADPRLTIPRAWAALDTGRIREAGDWIDATEAAIVHRPLEREGLRAELFTLRAVRCFKIGDIAGSLAAAGHAVKLDTAGSTLGASAAHCIHGSALYWSGQPEAARRAYRCAVRHAEEVDNHLGRTYALGYLAAICAQGGDLDTAEHLVRQIGAGAANFDTRLHFVDMMSALATAIIRDRRGDAVGGAEAVDMAVALARRGGAEIELANAILVRSAILTRLGNVGAAREGAEEAATLISASVNAASLRRGLASVALRTAPPTATERFTEKEAAVLRLMATPLSRSEISDHLAVSLNTVKTHQRAVFQKLGVTDRDAAVREAYLAGLL